MKRIAVILGSQSDTAKATPCFDALKALGIPFEARVISAHRTPDAARDFAKAASENGFGALIAMAGMAAHLAGALAAHTALPVIGVPLSSPALGGLDALLSTSQMPPGVPVATMGIDGAKNAALLAAEILAVGDCALYQKLVSMREDMARACAKSDDELNHKYGAAQAQNETEAEYNGKA